MEPTPGKPVPVNLIRLNYIQILIVIKRIVDFADFSLVVTPRLAMSLLKVSRKVTEISPTVQLG